MPKSTRHPIFQRFRQVRESFAIGLGRICYLLALGHFICVGILFYFQQKLSWHLHQTYQTYTYTVLGIGCALILIAYLGKYKRFRPLLPQTCLGLLFLQVLYLTYETRTVFHPITMLIPLITVFATPILGKRRSIAMAGLSIVSLTAIWYTSTPTPTLPFILLQILILFSAVLAEIVWNELIVREEALSEALKEIEKRNWEMESWIQRLGKMGSQINAGNYSAPMPHLPSDAVFQELTQSLELMQQKLNQYLTDLLLKDRLSSIGTLASGIAHELNTPLTTLQFILHSDPSIKLETRKLILAELDRMGKITRDLLYFAIPSPLENFELNEVIRKMQPLLSAEHHPNTQILYTFCSEEIWVEGIANQIQQIIFNLVHNSLDAIEDKKGETKSGEIHIQTRLDSHGSAFLMVSDNGCGIPQEHIPKILDPFYTTKDPGRGTGLGLFVVHQILKNFHAEIIIQSEEGNGTRIEIRIPIKQTISLPEAA